MTHRLRTTTLDCYSNLALSLGGDLGQSSYSGRRACDPLRLGCEGQHWGGWGWGGRNEYFRAVETKGPQGLRLKGSLAS